MYPSALQTSPRNFNEITRFCHLYITKTFPSPHLCCAPPPPPPPERPRGSRRSLPSNGPGRQAQVAAQGSRRKAAPPTRTPDRGREGPAAAPDPRRSAPGLLDLLAPPPAERRSFLFRRLAAPAGGPSPATFSPAGDPAASILEVASKVSTHFFPH